MITYSSDTPVWIRSWVDWSVNKLLPDWDVRVIMVENLDPDCPDDKGEAIAYSEYLRADISYDTSLQDCVDGHERVVHEVVHGILDEMGTAAERLITNKSVRKTAWKHYVDAEETTVVKLSRLLVSLRQHEFVAEAL